MSTTTYMQEPVTNSLTKRRETPATGSSVSFVKCSHSVTETASKKEVHTHNTERVHCCGIDFFLLPFHKCPEHFCDNPYILTGYRHEYTFKQAFLSMFMFTHNETMNIWTHFLGFLVMVGLSFDAFFVRAVDGDLIDYCAFAAFLFSGMYVMFASTCFHLFRCVSEEYDSLFLRLDAAGIGCIIYGSFIPPAVFLFRGSEHAFAFHFYLTVVTTLFMCCTAMTLIKRFSTVQHFMTRAIVFCAFGLFGIIPITHMWLLGMFEPGELQFQLLVPLLCGIGVVFHVLRLPERWLPGKFDIYGHGHQIFHVLVLMALVSHYISCVGYFEHRFYDLY